MLTLRLASAVPERVTPAVRSAALITPSPAMVALVWMICKLGGAVSSTYARSVTGPSLRASSITLSLSVLAPTSVAPVQIRVVSLTKRLMFCQAAPPSTEPSSCSPSSKGADSRAVKVCTASRVIQSLPLSPVSLPSVRALRDVVGATTSTRACSLASESTSRPSSGLVAILLTRSMVRPGVRSVSPKSSSSSCVGVAWPPAAFDSTTVMVSAQACSLVRL